MVKLLRAETKKLKGSSILWIGIGSCFVLPIMALGINLSNTGDFTWVEYASQNLWPQIILLWPCIFGVFGSYIFTRERLENTYKNLLVIPVGRVRLSLAKLGILFIAILGMSLLTYLLNISGILVGVPISPADFVEGLWIYTKSGLLMFLCILPIVWVAMLSRKGFLLSICIAVIYSIGSFLASWVPLLAALIPIDVAWRIIGLKQFDMQYAFPPVVSYVSLGICSIVSLIGIIVTSIRQDA